MEAALCFWKTAPASRLRACACGGGGKTGRNAAPIPIARRDSAICNLGSPVLADGAGPSDLV